MFTFNVDTPTLFVRANFSEHEGALLIHDSLGNVVWAGVSSQPAASLEVSQIVVQNSDDYYLELSSLQEVDVPTYQLSLIPSSDPLSISGTMVPTHRVIL